MAGAEDKAPVAKADCNIRLQKEGPIRRHSHLATLHSNAWGKDASPTEFISCLDKPSLDGNKCRFNEG
jgi:hypothetical protein